jgi:uncharacterized protein
LPELFQEEVETMPYIRDIFQNTALIATALSWVLAQTIKTIITLIQTKSFVSERLFGAGGMPSAHSASVCALTICIARMCGLQSPEFAIAVCLCAVVIYDAMGVRRAAGEQAKVINRMVDVMEKEGSEISEKELKEYLGHTPIEVLAGLLLGIIVSLVIL